MRPALLWLAGCLPAFTALTAPVPGPFRPTDIVEMVFLPPVGYVGTIGAGNQARFDPNASVDAGELLRQALFRHDEKMHLQRPLVLADSSLRRRLPGLTFRVVRAMDQSHRSHLAQALPWLDTLLAARQQRYALLSSTWGYTRTAANYRGQLAKDLGVGLLTLGMLVPITFKCETHVGVAIYDAQTRTIVYYKSNVPAEKDPLEGVVIDRELTDMLARDFKLTDRI